MHSLLQFGFNPVYNNKARSRTLSHQDPSFPAFSHVEGDVGPGALSQSGDVDFPETMVAHNGKKGKHYV